MLINNFGWSKMNSLINLKGKKGLILGIANDKSIAWGIAKSLNEFGAELGFSYVNDSIKKRVEPLAQMCNSNIVLKCDVTCDSSIENFFDELSKIWDSFDFLVHSIAFSDKNQLKGEYVDTSRENFINTLAVSCYSFTALCQRAQKYMKSGGQILTLSYLGAERVMPHYNVMGIAKSALETSVKYIAVDLGKKNIRVNAISAGPIKTLAAAGINDFNKILEIYEQKSPIKNNINKEDVAKVAYFLISDLSSAITGQTLYVDNGFNIMGY